MFKLSYLCFFDVFVYIIRLSLVVDEDDEFGHIWDLWGIQSEPFAATRPLMVTPGKLKTDC